MSDQEAVPQAEPRRREIGKLAAALAKAQAEYEAISRNRSVTVKSDKGNYTFEYATLDEVLACTRPALSRHSIALVQLIDGDELHTGLLHESGETLWSVVPFQRPQSPQQLGSLLTYLRRYSIVSLLGVAAEEDDDGNAAQGNQIEAKSERPRQPSRQESPRGTSNLSPPPRQKLSPAAVNTVRRALDKVFDPVPKEKGDAQEAAIKQRVIWIAGVINREPDGLADLFEDEAAKVMEAIDKRAQGAAQ